MIEKFGEYIVNIKKPPIRPPVKIIKESLFYYGESKESITRHKNWNNYIKAYGEALRSK